MPSDNPPNLAQAKRSKAQGWQGRRKVRWGDREGRIENGIREAGKEKGCRKVRWGGREGRIENGYGRQERKRDVEKEKGCRKVRWGRKD
ncbi:hypothetical protein Pmani_037020 [Petrolisthes manimaculis]|uniref:Uncharacterized protein n=1 Tax=Petrolisthes manimaculis TaxID=1843537 RepID=A0AAE1TNR7_9EUCA|nr:hypothetical protein Pmani_037020 [Petrolisthes manimaculis]